MTIGQALKSLRLHAGLTQEEMAAGIVSVSFYSKVERDIHEIDTNTLIKILSTHRFDVVEFLLELLIKIKVKVIHIMRSSQKLLLLKILKI